MCYTNISELFLLSFHHSHPSSFVFWCWSSHSVFSVPFQRLPRSVPQGPFGKSFQVYRIRFDSLNKFERNSLVMADILYILEHNKGSGRVRLIFSSRIVMFINILSVNTKDLAKVELWLYGIYSPTSCLDIEVIEKSQETLCRFAFHQLQCYYILSAI